MVTKSAIFNICSLTSSKLGERLTVIILLIVIIVFSLLKTYEILTVCVELYFCFFKTYSLYSFVSISMGLCACNSAGHLSNHADLAPNHAGVTFAVSNTIVSNRFMHMYVCI